MEKDLYNVGAANQKVHALAKQFFDVHTLQINTDDNRFLEVSMTLNGRKATTTFSFDELKSWSEEGSLGKNVAERFRQFKGKME